MSAGGGCEAAVTARTRCWWVKLKECGDFFMAGDSLQSAKGLFISYIRPAILHGSDALCLKESEVGILQRTERSMVRAMCGVQLKDRKRYTDLIFMLGLKETLDQLAVANSVRWYGHVLRREDGHVLRRALYFEAECQRKKRRPKRNGKKVEEESMKVGLRRNDALCCSKWSASINKIAAELK